MNSDPADVVALLPGTISEVFIFFAPPFYDRLRTSFFLDDYSPSVVKEKTRRKRKPKEFPTKEKVWPIVRQLNQFLDDALKLLPGLLRRSSCNGAESDEGMLKEKATKLLSIYHFTFHCLLCIAPCLLGHPYSVQLHGVS